MTSKISFTENSFNLVLIDSSWQSDKKGLQKDFDSQTSADLYEFDDSETQTSVSVDAETQTLKIENFKDKDEV